MLNPFKNIQPSSSWVSALFTRDVKRLHWYRLISKSRTGKFRISKRYRGQRCGAMAQFFYRSNLQQLIDTALHNNQELSIIYRKLEIARNEIRDTARACYQTVEAGGGIGVKKWEDIPARELGDASRRNHRERVPEWLPDYRLGISASWKWISGKTAQFSQRRLMTVTSPLLRGQKFCGDKPGGWDR